MKATYNATAKTKFTRSHRKEGKCFFDSYQVIDLNKKPWADKEMASTIDLRLYGTGNQNFACLWVYADPLFTQGSGRAGGYGYDRPSAATQEAITNAGFTLWRNDKKDQHPADIGGVGESEIRKALCAIAECVGLTNYAIVKSHP